MRARLIACGALACLSSAQAADWVKLDIPNPPGIQDAYYYDRSKLVISGNEITYWKKVEFMPPRHIKQGLAGATLMRERIHCREHTLRLLSFLYNDAQGGALDYVADAEKDATPIIPDSVGDKYEQTLCPLTQSLPQLDPGPTTMEPHVL